ncbi:MAG: translation elongation factor 4 [Candidatus Omnitrophica bacterium]|nr:translation elongation factor 4 [Candidatus Omnitrophota bacterium]MDD5354995.1 translation elongation factor 4 [Candidatus Omnitrophota bacterium]
MDKALIRNFCIIAHIDHGKSTLADRLLLHTGAIDERHFRNQLLDDMDLERERGITIKSSAVRINYTASDNKEYVLNLIDTPGHVDFSYEVAKALAACEGALLVVDAAQGIEAQTLANFYLAKEQNLTIIPVINKIDLNNAQIDRVTEQICDVLNFEEKDIVFASAKEGIGIKDVLEKIISIIPPPKGNDDNPLQSLIFDSVFDIFKGVMIYIRNFNGVIKANSEIKMLNASKTYKVEEVGMFRPERVKVSEIGAGEVGYFTANMRDAKEVVIGDTVTNVENPTTEALPGYKKIKPLVFCGMYPVNAMDFTRLKDAMEKLTLNDSSFVFEPESSQSFGYGFRCGFLGLLHMEIIQERLEREYDLNLMITTPNVVYKVKKRNGEEIEVDNPAKLPPPNEIDEVKEPYIQAFIIIPVDSLETTCELAKEKRGTFITQEFLGQDRIKIIFNLPLAEVIVDFYDKIKSITRGYGSLDYELLDYRPTKLVKLDILLNGKLCDAFSCLIYKDKAQTKGRLLATKLRELIPRQLFEVNIQAAIGSQVIAAERIRSVSKDVTAKCYGGDITRKRKLWEKQKKGKKRLKQFGQVQIPQEAFLTVLKI